MDKTCDADSQVTLIKINYVGCRTLILRSDRFAVPPIFLFPSSHDTGPPNEVRGDGFHACISFASLRMSRSDGDERQHRGGLG